MEYETHTTKVYKDYGKDYRVLCNDLTGNNNRAVKKIKREIGMSSGSGNGSGNGSQGKVSSSRSGTGNGNGVSTGL